MQIDLAFDLAVLPFSRGKNQSLGVIIQLIPDLSCLRCQLKPLVPCHHWSCQPKHTWTWFWWSSLLVGMCLECVNEDINVISEFWYCVQFLCIIEFTILDVMCVDSMVFGTSEGSFLCKKYGIIGRGSRQELITVLFIVSVMPLSVLCWWAWFLTSHISITGCTAFWSMIHFWPGEIFCCKDLFLVHANLILPVQDKAVGRSFPQSRTKANGCDVGK